MLYVHVHSDAGIVIRSHPMPPKVKPPRALRILAQHGGEALRPKIVMGRYIPPLISKRVAAKARKRAIVDGTFGSFKLLDENGQTRGGWDPSWDIPRRFHFLKPPKGHKRERSRQTRYIISVWTQFLLFRC